MPSNSGTGMAGPPAQLVLVSLVPYVITLRISGALSHLNLYVLYTQMKPTQKQPENPHCAFPYWTELDEEICDLAADSDG
jgi:hypothetical protein